MLALQNCSYDIRLWDREGRYIYLYVYIYCGNEIECISYYPIILLSYYINGN